ncbi:MAG: 16S rRNA (cytosine(1402)-N(4))-methyltransferase RsmH [Candidatus Sericytochromatia bacterium]
MDTTPFSHQPVLLAEVLAQLDPRPGQVMLDGTVGGAGHASELLARLLPDGFLYGIDQDPVALEAARARLATVSDRFELFKANFEAIGSLPLPPLDGILLDLGVSSPQLDVAERGFSFQQEGPLDMRMSPDNPMTAERLVNQADEQELARVLYEYGEERFSRKVARAIVERRKQEPFKTTRELAEFVARLVPRDPSGIHPATLTFQGLRIAVNDELGVAARALPQAVARLKPGGRLAVISFHSLEDRLVKQFFRAEAKGCTCPPRLPMCVCGKQPTIRVLTSKPVVATEEEVRCNPRSRSAKLRVAERLAPSQ